MEEVWEKLIYTVIDDQCRKYQCLISLQLEAFLGGKLREGHAVTSHIPQAFSTLSTTTATITGIYVTQHRKTDCIVQPEVI